MSDQTFEQLYKRLLVYSPDLPVPLAQEFINTAYSRMLEAKNWAHLRKEDGFVIPASYSTGTVTVTQDSATVTGSGTTWTAAMVGRQFFVGGQAPYYTITGFTSTTSITLDREYEKATAAGASYVIQQVYVTVPSDFGGFVDVVDLSNNWRLRTNINQELLDRWDAQRTSSGTTWCIVPTSPSPVTATLGQMRYELWPRPSTAGVTYPFRYWRSPVLLSALSDRPIAPFRGDVIRDGALARLALWPGTSQTRNPYFDMNLHRMHEDLFQKGLLSIMVTDEEYAQTMVTYADWDQIPYAPIDAKFLQSHDFLMFS